MSEKMQKRRERLGPEYADSFVYTVDPSVVHMLRSGEPPLKYEILRYLGVYLGQQALKYGYKKFVAVPLIGRRDEIILDGDIEMVTPEEFEKRMGLNN